MTRMHELWGGGGGEHRNALMIIRVTIDIVNQFESKYMNWDLSRK